MNTKAEFERCTIPLVIGNSKPTKNIGVFDAIIGQNEAIKQLSYFIESNSDETPMPTLLFTGSQGLGKSFMARKVAESLGRDMIVVNCGTILTTKDFVEDILIHRVNGESKTILLDESHKLSLEISTFLLSLLENNASNKTFCTYKKALIEYDFSKINIIFATTDAYMMLRALVNRCREVYFHIYSNDELYRILSYYLPGIALTCDQNDISYACRGRARDAFALSQDIKRYCLKNKTQTFDNKGWTYLKEVFGIHAFGLRTQEVNFMRILAESSPISCNNIAVRMGVNAQNIESEIEIRPRELGFVESGTRGRCITSEGLAYLKAVK